MATRVAGFVVDQAAGLGVSGITMTPRAGDGSAGTTGVTDSSGYVSVAGLADKVWFGTIASAGRCFVPTAITEQIVSDDLHGQSNTLAAHDFSQLRGSIGQSQIPSGVIAFSKLVPSAVQGDLIIGDGLGGWTNSNVGSAGMFYGTDGIINQFGFVSATQLFVSAADKIIGTAGSAGFALELDCTAAGRALIDDASASAQRTTLGLGTIATLNTPLAVASGGTGQTNAQAAFNALDPLTALGDILYHDGTNSTVLVGNITSTKKLLRQTGTGSVSAAPAWDTLVAGDLPVHTHESAGQGGQLNATNIFSAGTVPTARLGSGTADATTFLRGDQTWQVVSGVGTHVVLDSTVHTDTLTGTVVLGDLIHGNATPKWAKLAGNITATKKFLNQTGTGAVSAVPSWDTLTDADIPDTITIASLSQVTARRHDNLTNYDDMDSHTQLMHITNARTITAEHLLSGATMLAFRDSSATFIRSSANGLLSLYAVTGGGVEFWNDDGVGHVLESMMAKDRFTMNNGATDTFLDWSTSAILGLGVGANIELKLAAGILRMRDGVSSSAPGLDFLTDGQLAISIPYTTQKIIITSTEMTLVTGGASDPKFNYGTINTLITKFGLTESCRQTVNSWTMNAGATDPGFAWNVNAVLALTMAGSSRWKFHDAITSTTPAIEFQNTGGTTTSFRSGTASVLDFFSGTTHGLQFGNRFLTVGPANTNYLRLDCATDNQGKVLMASTEIARFTTADVTFFEEAIFSAAKGCIFNSGSAAASVEGALWNDSTQKCLTAYVDGAIQYDARTLFVQTADVAVNGFTIETSQSLIGTGIGTTTLPANFLTIGKTIEVEASGIYSTDAANVQTISFDVRLGGSSLPTTLFAHTPAGGISSKEWMVKFSFTCRTTGSSGTVRGSGVWMIQNSANTPVWVPMPMSSSLTVNTTGTLAVDVKVTIDGTNDADNAVTCTNVRVRVSA